MKKLEIWQKILWQIGHGQDPMNPPPPNKRLEILQHFLWQIWHDQNLMYPTPQLPEGCGWDQDGTQTQTGQGWNTHT